ncbi:ATP-dependent DNA helicase 2 subunit 1 [Schistocerca gregaria]|uniref:ATP-dependent DNA helicase 2 subunit 1 n=1 Tax=Schistocerca gregaria TaxID=7010 RepID=UPI00211EEEAA|nr:ATP-dependent DNA helicase 2 subunit 1 [Schistocerca gregaria]
MDITALLEEVDDKLDSASAIHYGGTDGTIFVIDCTDGMYEKCEYNVRELNGENLLTICLQCCRGTILSMLHNAPRDFVSIVLFGTKLSNNPLSVNHIFILQDLDFPKVERIKQLDEAIKGGLHKFRQEYGCSDDYEMHDVFWVCHRIFTESRKKLGSKRIVLMTNSDDPHNGSLTKQHNARITAKNLRKDRVDLSLVYFSDTFDPSRFYEALYEKDADEFGVEWSFLQKELILSDLKNRTMIRSHTMRAYATLRFKLKPKDATESQKDENDLEFAVRLFHLMRKVPKPKKTHVHRETNETVYRGGRINADTGELVETFNVSYWKVFAGEKVEFTSLELKEIKNIMEPGIQLVGFKPKTMIKPELHVKRPTFIYPANDVIKGSSTIFSALLLKCIARNVVPICWVCERRGASPRLGALLPQRQEFDKHNRPMAYDGFHIIYIPFRSEIRDCTLQNVEEASPEMVSVAEKVISKLKMTYNPCVFTNPKIQKMRQYLEAAALDYPTPEFEDSTMPDMDDMKEKLGSLSIDFAEATNLPNYTSDKPPPKKRAGADGNAENTSKVRKLDKSEIQKLAEQGQIEKLTVNQLKEYLQSEGVRGISTKKKQELVEMVYNSVN